MIFSWNFRSEQYKSIERLTNFWRVNSSSILSPLNLLYKSVRTFTDVSLLSICNSIHIYININILRNKHYFFVVFLSVINCILSTWCYFAICNKSNNSIWIFDDWFVSNKEMFNIIFFTIFKLTLCTIRIVWFVIWWKFSIFYTK